MNAALTFQIGLNDCARAIRGKFTFAGALESFQRQRLKAGWNHFLKMDTTQTNAVL